MSHFVDVRTEIKSIDAARAAAERLGLKMEGPGRARGYGGNTTQADFVIRLDGGYDVGLVKGSDGSYSLVADWSFGREVVARLGHNGEKFMQAYAAEQVKALGEANGFHVESEAVRQDGAIVMELNNYVG